MTQESSKSKARKQEKLYTLWGGHLRLYPQDTTKGRMKFNRMLQAREQLEQVVRRHYPGAHVYVFGSCVAHQMWDGDSDIDFTCIDPNAWAKGRWPPHNERLVILECSSTLGRLAEPRHVLSITGARVPILKYSKIRGEKKNNLNQVSLIEYCGTDVPQGNGNEEGNSLCLIVIFQKPGYSGDLLTQSQENVGKRIQEMLPDVPLLFNWSGDHGNYLTITFPEQKYVFDAYVKLRTTPKIGPAPIASVVLSLKTLSNQAGLSNETHRQALARIALFSVDFDLSTRAFGLRNSYLLQRYIQQNPMVSVGAHAIKNWSKCTGLNNSSCGWLCTYAFHVMWLHFLLREGVVEYVSPESIPENPLLLPVAPQYNPCYLPNELWGKMGRLLQNFFHYFANDFSWDSHVITINRKKSTMKEFLKWGSDAGQSGSRKKSLQYYVAIEDPYEVDFNLGRHMSWQRYSFMKEKFVEASNELGTKDPLRCTLFSPVFSKEEKETAVHMASLALEIVRRLESVPFRQLMDLVETKVADLPGAEHYISILRSALKSVRLFRCAGLLLDDTDEVRLPRTPEEERSVKKERKIIRKSMDLVNDFDKKLKHFTSDKKKKVRERERPKKIRERLKRMEAKAQEKLKHQEVKTKPITSSTLPNDVCNSKVNTPSIQPEDNAREQGTDKHPEFSQSCTSKFSAQRQQVWTETLLTKMSKGLSNTEYSNPFVVEPVGDVKPQKPQSLEVPLGMSTNLRTHDLGHMFQPSQCWSLRMLTRRR